jgi:hypothetical protein
MHYSNILGLLTVLKSVNGNKGGYEQGNQPARHRSTRQAGVIHAGASGEQSGSGVAIGANLPGEPVRLVTIRADARAPLP